MLRKFGTIVLVLLINQGLQARTFQIPAKYLDRQLQHRVQENGYFTQHLINNNNFVHVKNVEWTACHQESSGFSVNALGGVNGVRNFMQTPQIITDLKVMESQNLLAGKVERQPWSGDYWAYASGIIGARYQDEAFGNFYDWLSRFNYVQENSMKTVLASHGQDGVRTLSPGEKYDLLVGDMESTLTKLMWQEGRRYYDANGEVEGWMGICHGWSPAAIMENRPSHSVDAVSADGKYQIHFNPSEIKGIASYTWAVNSYQAITLGHRCNKKDPAVDENGRITDPECFDINPADWHLVMVNRVGAQKKSFVMDATFDYQVWNQPVLAYEYKYFNPKTMRAAHSLDEATVRREEYTGDKYARYRSADVKYMVGIAMRMAYVVETAANIDDTDTPDNDQIRWVEYKYDLELDANKNIIGGEWYQESHPDFVWTPRNGEAPKSFMDDQLRLADWQGATPVPASWVEAAEQTSPEGKPLLSVGRALILRAN